MAILRGSTKLGYKESKPYFRAVCNLLQVRDAFQRERCEQLLGSPLLVARELGGLRHYGSFGLSTVEDCVYTFQSVLSMPGGVILTSFLGVLSSFMRKNLDNMVIIGLKLLLDTAVQEEVVSEYLFLLPSLTIQCQSFVHQIEIYVSKLVEEANNQDLSPYLMDKKE